MRRTSPKARRRMPTRPAPLQGRRSRATATRRGGRGKDVRDFGSRAQGESRVLLGLFWGQTNQRRCGNNCSPTSASFNPPTRPRTGSTRTLPAKNTLIDADADAGRSRLPRKARNDRGGVRGLPGRSNRSRPAKESLLRVEKPFLARWTTQPRPNHLALGPLAHAAVALRRRPFACATRSTASSSPRSRALSAAGRRPRRTIFASPNRARSAEKSATNTRSQSAVSITASCTATAMKPHGGRRSGLSADQTYDDATLRPRFVSGPQARGSARPHRRRSRR